MMNMMTVGQEYLQELLKAVQNLNLTFNMGKGLFGIAAYVLLALGLYTIAKKRGINHPWLAWIPVGNTWLLGCISDQYHYVAKDEVRNRRKRMLTLSIIGVALAVLLGIGIAVLIIQLGTWAITGMAAEGMADMLLTAVLTLFLLLPVSVVSIWLTVETFCAYYDLFSSCCPNEKTLFTVLSIIASLIGLNILAAIFIFVCRNKEEGMPPRKQEPVVYDQEVPTPVYPDEEPYRLIEDEPPFVEQ